MTLQSSVVWINHPGGPHSHRNPPQKGLCPPGPPVIFLDGLIHPKHRRLSLSLYLSLSLALSLGGLVSFAFCTLFHQLFWANRYCRITVCINSNSQHQYECFSESWSPTIPSVFCLFVLFLFVCLSSFPKHHVLVATFR